MRKKFERVAVHVALKHEVFFIVGNFLLAQEQFGLYKIPHKIPCKFYVIDISSRRRTTERYIIKVAR